MPDVNPAKKPITVVGCTTVAENYLSFARILARSWTRFHPNLRFYVLVIDSEPSEIAARDFQALSSEEIGLDQRELQVRRAMYGPLEFSTSLKPHLIKFLLNHDADAVIFVDPDSDIYAGLEDVGVAAAQHGISLTPHLLEPIPLDDRSPSELDVQASGIFNTGLMGVGRSAVPFLDWWAERLKRDCRIDPDAGLYVDQRWVDWVPSLFPYTVLRDPTLNVAHWNVHERELEWTDDEFTVEERPLRHFHFSGFDPYRPDLITTYLYARPFRVRMADHPALRRLHKEYADRLLASGYQDARTHPYAFSSSVTGTKLSKWARTVYREAVLVSEAGGTASVPDPFDPADAASFERLVADPTSSDALPPVIRAHLAQAQEIIGEDSWRSPSSRVWRFAHRVRDRIRRVFVSRSPLRKEKRRRRAIDQVLLEYIADVDRRLDAEILDMQSRVEKRSDQLDRPEPPSDN